MHSLSDKVFDDFVVNQTCHSINGDWRVTRNYVCSPFKHYKKVDNNGC